MSDWNDAVLQQFRGNDGNVERFGRRLDRGVDFLSTTP